MEPTFQSIGGEYGVLKTVINITSFEASLSAARASRGERSNVEVVVLARTTERLIRLPLSVATTAASALS